MSYSKLKENLEAEGWFVGWKLPCCQTCAWWDVPDEADHSKVLFNHEQDCEAEEEECEYCRGDGYIMESHPLADDEEEVECMNCQGLGHLVEYYEHGDDAEGSYFCFDGSKEGVKNLKKVLPIIEESGCDWTWDKTGKTRIYIGWK